MFIYPKIKYSQIPLKNFANVQLHLESRNLFYFAHFDKWKIKSNYILIESCYNMNDPRQR